MCIRDRAGDGDGIHRAAADQKPDRRARQLAAGNIDIDVGQLQVFHRAAVDHAEQADGIVRACGCRDGQAGNGFAVAVKDTFKRILSLIGTAIPRAAADRRPRLSVQVDIRLQRNGIALEFSCVDRRSDAGKSAALPTDTVRAASSLSSCSRAVAETPSHTLSGHSAPLSYWSLPKDVYKRQSIHCAASNACITSCRDAPGRARRTLSRIDALIRRLSWNTKATVSISCFFGIRRTSVPPIRIRPLLTSKKREMRLALSLIHICSNHCCAAAGGIPPPHGRCHAAAVRNGCARPVRAAGTAYPPAVRENTAGYCCCPGSVGARCV